MKYWLFFLASLFKAVVVLSAAGASCGWAQDMTGGRGGMMSREGMREMMQGMMGDMLPPRMDYALLPDRNSQGAVLLERFCTQCHYRPGPGLHTATEWPAVVIRMDRRMQMMSRRGMMMGIIEAPDKQEMATILGYLQTHALKPLAARLTPSLETPSGKAFRDVCSKCHALPDPRQHVAQKWPALVERMKGYMKTMGKKVPDEKTLSGILGFLQRNAGGEKERIGDLFP